VKKILLAFLLGLIFCGCSITPRYHSFGYNVEWKTRGTTRAKTSASPIQHRCESQKRSDLDRNAITGEENRSETAKTGSFKEENRFLIDTIRKTEFSIPVRIALDTAVKSVKKKKMDRNIKLTNALLMGDLISMPLVLGLTNGEDFIGIIYVLLIAFPLLIILLIARIIQGIRRRRLERKNAIHGQGNQTQSSYTAEKNVRMENQDPGPTVVRDGHKSANWGLFLVLLGIAAVAVGGTFFITPIGYVLSIIGKQRSEKGSTYFKRAKAGTILGLITILLDLLVLLLVIAYFY